MTRSSSTRWLLRVGGLAICWATCFGLAVAGADARTLIVGKHGHLAQGQSAEIFRSNAFATVRLECTSSGPPNFQVHNSENRTLRVTRFTSDSDFDRRSEQVDPDDTKEFQLFGADVGITDLGDKFATLDIDWGRRDADNSCDFAVQTLLRLP
jgi:hypothetical protein